jgi:hypothetical protein
MKQYVFTKDKSATKEKARASWENQIRKGLAADIEAANRAMRRDEISLPSK